MPRLVISRSAALLLAALPTYLRASGLAADPINCAEVSSSESSSEESCRLLSQWQQGLKAQQKLRDLGFDVDVLAQSFAAGAPGRRADSATTADPSHSSHATTAVPSHNSSNDSNHSNHSNTTAEHDTSSAEHDTGSEEHVAEHETHVTHQKDGLLFMFTTLAYGCVLCYGLSRLAPFLPYTVFCYLLGMTIGAIDRKMRDTWPDDISIYSQSIVMWRGIDPHMMLHAFLPGLLFGDALSINKHQFWKCLGSCTLLATLGVLYGALLTALSVFYMAPKGLTFYESWTQGAILSATDPVAVVAILNSLGASAKLNMLVSGESLMNDGVALVVYTVFHDMSKGKEYGAGDMISYFFQLFFGGIGLGLVFGFLTAGLMALASSKMHHEDTVVQTALMFSCAYLSFWTAESSQIQVSGVLSCVTASIVIAFYAKQVLVERASVEHVWHFAEYVGNTLLFMLAGVMVGDLLVSNELELDGGDVGWFIGLYVLMNLIRLIVVFSFYPLLVRMGYGVTWQECIMMVWGGLRGAVGLAMAVEVATVTVDHQGNALDNDTMLRRKYIMLQVGVFTTMTLVINAPTTGWITRKLGLVKPSKTEVALLESHQKRLQTTAFDFLAGIKGKLIFEGFDEDVVHSVILAANHSSHDHGSKSTKYGDLDTDDECIIDKVDESEDLSVQRDIFLRLVGADYWQMVDNGIIPTDTDILPTLMASVDHAKDYVTTGLLDWESVHTSCTRVDWILNRLGPSVRAWKVVKLIEQMVEGHAVITLNCYIAAHEYAQERAAKHLSGGSLERILTESKANVELALKFMSCRNFESVQLAKTWQLSKTILELQRHKIHKWVSNGILTEGQAHTLLHGVSSGQSHLTHHVSSRNLEKSGIDLHAMLHVGTRMSEIAHQHLKKDDKAQMPDDPDALIMLPNAIESPANYLSVPLGAVAEDEYPENPES
ncbi:unnamed protein product [Polarella glacialis]|uniref:Cation/H+ exchanger transmembrane domain-containing protein n=1 Tax=Polarella glacialis TaxID=89957 RepID=A0A813KNB7_POLGL|nr:unnamed protein product [Polarella glacialis]CAE8708688.1 unnamed protein product [Polarella glacialis]